MRRLASPLKKPIKQKGNRGRSRISYPPDKQEKVTQTELGQAYLLVLALLVDPFTFSQLRKYQAYGVGLAALAKWG